MTGLSLCRIADCSALCCEELIEKAIHLIFLHPLNRFLTIQNVKILELLISFFNLQILTNKERDLPPRSGRNRPIPHTYVHKICADMWTSQFSGFQLFPLPQPSGMPRNTTAQSPTTATSSRPCPRDSPPPSLTLSQQLMLVAADAATTMACRCKRRSGQLDRRARRQHKRLGSAAAWPSEVAGRWWESTASWQCTPG